MGQRVQGSTSVSANSTSSNVLSGKILEIVTRPSQVAVYAAASAVGLNGTFVCGSDLVTEESAVSQANRFPIVPDDVVTGGRGRGRLILTFRNTTGGALTVNWAIDVG